MKSKAKTAYLYKREYYCFVVAVSLLLAAIAAYIYFVSASIVHVVIRKEINQATVIQSSYISELESEYIELQHAVSEDIATQNGFVAVRDKIYVDRTPTSLVLAETGDDG